MRCEKCNRELFKDSDFYWSAWHALICQVELLCSEENITVATRDLMIGNLMMLKVLVSDKEEKNKKNG